MDYGITLKSKLQLFSRYIGQEVWLEKLYTHGTETRHQVGTLTGIRTDAVQVRMEEVYQWVTLQDQWREYEVKLLLKPLSSLTDQMKEIANSLPVTVFITQYYVQMGFDMPVFISPGHPLNCRYAENIGFADYRSAEEILALNEHHNWPGCGKLSVYNSVNNLL